MVEFDCEVCGNRSHRVMRDCHDRREGTGYSGKLVRCDQCGVVTTYPMPEPESLPAYYPESYAPHVQRTARKPSLGPVRRWIARPRAVVPWSQEFLGGLYNLLAYRSIPIARAPGRLLDVGCGVGDYLSDMREVGWDGMGVEVAPAAAARARGRGLRVVQGTIFDGKLDGRRFELVTMWHVLEHLRRPTAALQRARELLAEGGNLMLAVPNWGSVTRMVTNDAWWCQEVPRHLYHFTSATLHFALKSAGFSSVRVRSKSRPQFIARSLELAAHVDLGALRPWVSLALLPADVALALAKRSDTLWGVATP